MIYNCRTGEISASYVHPKVRNFIFDKAVGLANSYVVERSILDRISPARFLKSLENDSAQYIEWLKSLGNETK